MLMASQLQRHGSAVTKQFLYQVTESVCYITLVIGYLISIFSATHLTLVNVLAFTTTQLLYAFVFWQATTNNNTHSKTLFWLVLLSLLTFLGGMTSVLGIYLDWLLYFVTVTVFCIFLSLPLALPASSILYLSVGFTFYLISGAIGLSAGTGSFAA